MVVAHARVAVEEAVLLTRVDIVAGDPGRERALVIVEGADALRVGVINQAVTVVVDAVAALGLANGDLAAGVDAQVRTAVAASCPPLVPARPVVPALPAWPPVPGCHRCRPRRRDARGEAGIATLGTNSKARIETTAMDQNGVDVFMDAPCRGRAHASTSASNQRGGTAIRYRKAPPTFPERAYRNILKKVYPDDPDARNSDVTGATTLAARCAGDGGGAASAQRRRSRGANHHCALPRGRGRRVSAAGAALPASGLLGRAAHARWPRRGRGRRTASVRRRVRRAGSVPRRGSPARVLDLAGPHRGRTAPRTSSSPSAGARSRWTARSAAAKRRSRTIRRRRKPTRCARSRCAVWSARCCACRSSTARS